MTLRTTITSHTTASLTDDNGTYGVGPNGGTSNTVTLTSGTGASQADIAYSRRRTIVDNATPLSLDLAGGSLLGPNGDAVSFVEVVQVDVINRSTVQVVTVGGGTNAPAWLPAVALPPGGRFTLTAVVNPAFVVTAGTGDILTLATDGGTNVLVDVFIVGRSA